MPPALDRRNLEHWTFLALFGLGLYLFWLIAQPLWVPLFSGMLIAMAVHPLHRRLVQRFPRRETISAAVLTGLVLLVMLAFGGLLTFVVLGQLVDLARDVSDRYAHGGSAEVLGARLQAILTSLGQDPEQLRQELVSATEDAAANLGRTAARFASASLGGVLVIVLTVITAYFLLREGARLTEWFVGVLPLPDAQVRELARNFRDVTQTTLLGTGVTALYEAMTAFLGYWFAGVPRPLVWAALTGVASVLPAVGTAVVVAPIAVWLMATGHLFGGVAAFGLLGVILGPIVTAFLVSLVHIYQREYRPGAAAARRQRPDHPRGAA